MSTESDSFVNSLKAAFPFMSQDAVALYQGKLARWHLTRNQWLDALDKLLRVETEGNPPQLSAIYAELERQSRLGEQKPSMGWVYFTLHGVDYATRIRNDSGTWVIADLTWTDAHGTLRHAQPHYGEPYVRHMPPEAKNIRQISDDIYIQPEELIKPEEIAEIVGNTKLGSMPAKVIRFRDAANK